MKPPYRADQVGSLLRPAKLREARLKLQRDSHELREIENTCIEEAVKRQEAVGLQAVTDGELRRDYWHLDFTRQLDGVTLKAAADMTFNAEDVPPMATITGKVGCSKPIFVDHFALAVTMHTCRGNFRSAWFASGGYNDEVIEAMFSTPVDGYFMEYDSERSGGFEPLRLLPRGKKVVLGLVTTKKGELESKRSLVEKIREAEKHVPLENLCLSPQCGFASTHHGNALSEDEQWRKLALVVEVAREVWN